MINSNINIAFICGSNSWGGLEKNQLNYSFWLKNKGYNVILFCRKNSKIEIEAKEKNILIDYLKEHRRYKYFFAGIYLSKLLKRHNITHIICRDSKDLNICSIAKSFSKKKIKLCYIMEMQLGVSKKNFLHTARFKKIDYWVCPLNYLKKQVLSLTKFPERKIFILPSAIEFHEPKDNKNCLLKKYNLTNDYFILGLIGRIDPLKGHKHALETFDLLPDKKIALFIIGSPTLNEKKDFFHEIIKRIDFINKSSINKKVIYLSHIENLSNIMTLFDVCLMPSKSETFGMVTLESLSYGIPVIATNSGGSPELLQYGKYGLLYSFEKNDELKENIMKLYNNMHFKKNELIEYSKEFEKNKILTKLEKIIFNNEK